MGDICSADFNGINSRVIIPEGGTFTPKQLYLDVRNGRLYWCDRGGMRVVHSNLDRSEIETLVLNGKGDEDSHDVMKWCVGFAVDAGREQIYWTQKGPDYAGKSRRIFR